jgi:hypothetical protein
MADKQKYTFQMTEPTPITYVNLDKPKAVKNKGAEKYSVNFEFAPDHADVPALKALLAQIANEAFQGVPFDRLHFPLQSGDKLADAAEKGNREFSRGKLVLVTRTNFPVQLGAIINGNPVDIEQDDVASIKRFIYPGSNALGKFEFNTYAEFNGKPGINVYPKVVFSYATGERVAGGGSATETFKGHIGLKTDFDPTSGGVGGGNQSIPL